MTDAITDQAFRSLDPRVIPLDRAVGWIAAATLAGAAGMALLMALVALDGLPVLLGRLLIAGWMAFAVLLAWQAQAWPPRKFAHVRYRADEQGIEIHRGVFWREVVNVPRSRVQHTDVTQGPIERRLGLGTLVVYTAGTAFARVELDGLAYDDALRLRSALLPRATADAV